MDLGEIPVVGSLLNVAQAFQSCAGVADLGIACVWVSMLSVRWPLCHEGFTAHGRIGLSCDTDERGVVAVGDGTSDQWTEPIQQPMNCMSRICIV